MTRGPNRWLAHLSYSQRQVQLRHRSSVPQGRNFIDLLHLPLVYDRWAQQVASPPVIQPKAGAVEGRGVDGQHTRECNIVCTSHIKAPRPASPIYEILRTLTKGKSDHSNRKIS